MPFKETMKSLTYGTFLIGSCVSCATMTTGLLIDFGRLVYDDRNNPTEYRRRVEAGEVKISDYRFTNIGLGLGMGAGFVVASRELLRERKKNRE
mgnify:CR=1 FL=1